MAANRDALNCGVCFHAYSDDAKDRKHPRLLLCSHTVCYDCYLGLVGTSSVTCPFCRKVFRLGTSRENPYVMAHLLEKRELEQKMRQEREDWKEQIQEERRKNKQEHEERKKREEKEKLKTCEEHGREENLFCCDSECHKPICSLCMSRNHLKHKVVDLKEVQESKREECLKEDTILEQNAGMFHEKVEAEYEENLSQVEEHLKTVMCVKERVVKEITTKFDDLYEEIRKNVREYKDLFIERQKALEAVTESVKSRKPRIQSYTGSFYKELLDEQTAHEMVKKDFNKVKEEKRVFTFQRYRESAHFGEVALERICGTLAAETIEEQEDETDPAKAEEKSTDETEAVENEVKNTEEAEQNDDEEAVEVKEKNTEKADEDTNMEETRGDMCCSEDEANDEKKAAAETDVVGETDDVNEDSDEDQTENDELNKENDNPNDVHKVADGVESSCTERKKNIRLDASVLGNINRAVQEHLQMLANSKRPLYLSEDKDASTPCTPSKRTKTS